MYRQINRDLYGITSLIFILTALIVADIDLLEEHMVAGIFYSIIIIVATGLLLFTFCMKCPCKNHCGHLIPGRIAMHFKTRKTGPYTNTDNIIVSLSLLSLIVFPQLWLWENRGLFLIFWIILIIGIIQIRSVVCRSCENVYCPLNAKIKDV